jgi:transcriptional regulator with XRE-family HTH domain
MDDMRVGAAFRAVRLRRRWRQQDVAERAAVSRALVSLIERGHVDHVTLAALRRVGAVLDVRVDVVARWRGGELDRLINARHSALHESVAEMLGGLDGWVFAPEVSFSVFGERGVIDILAFHRPTRSLLVIELKTAIVDVNDLIGGIDRKTRLAAKIAAGRGWDAATVSCWLIVDQGRTNQRRLLAHRHVLRGAFPDTGRRATAWLRRPEGRMAAMSMWPFATRADMAPPLLQRPRGQAANGVRG